MARAIIFPFHCTDTSLEKLEPSPDPVSSSGADFAAATLPLGPAPANWEALANGHTVVSGANGARTVVEESGTRFVRLDSAAYNTDFTNAGPRTRFIRVRLHSVRAGGIFMSNATPGNGVNVLVDVSTGNFAMFNGTTLVSTIPADTAWHTIVTTFDSGAGTIRVDGVEMTGSVGTNDGEGFRLGASLHGEYYSCDIARAGFLPYAAGAAERAAIEAAIS